MNVTFSKNKKKKSKDNFIFASNSNAMKVFIDIEIDSVPFASFNATKYLTRNFYQFLYSQFCASDSNYHISSGFSSLDSIGINNGGLESISATERYNFANSIIFNHQSKIIIGQGNFPFNVDQYELISPYYSGLVFTSSTVYNNNGLINTGKLSFDFKREFTNVSGNDQLVSEIGLSSVLSLGGSLLLLRYVLPAPLLIIDSSVLSITIRFES